MPSFELLNDALVRDGWPIARKSKASGSFHLADAAFALNEGRLRLASSPERYDSGRLVGNPSLIGKVRIAR